MNKFTKNALLLIGRSKCDDKGWYPVSEPVKSAITDKLPDVLVFRRTVGDEHFIRLKLKGQQLLESLQ